MPEGVSPFLRSMPGSSAVWLHTCAAFLHHPADQAHRGGQPGLLPAVAWRRGGATAPRASLVVERTTMEEAVYEIIKIHGEERQDQRKKNYNQYLKFSGAGTYVKAFSPEMA
ncbi:uncharacterized protein [Triticum aestivum]|uniref:uncharacterized protein n=1 Tax=Triticum aestivum TaxID=4565 RepID=UPI001D01E196|nr:uncharacterized protein LOC123130598 [Triticum aestivum]